MGAMFVMSMSQSWRADMIIFVSFEASMDAMCDEMGMPESK
jgi:hypothetical protein